MNIPLANVDLKVTGRGTGVVRRLGGGGEGVRGGGK